MSCLAIQLSVAAVFLTTVVCASDLSSDYRKFSKSNPPCHKLSNPMCEKESQDCTPSNQHGLAYGICFDKIKPSGKNTVDGKPEHGTGEIMSQAHVWYCASETYLDRCKSCCNRGFLNSKLFRIDGEVHVDGEGESCLCVAIRL